MAMPETEQFIYVSPDEDLTSIRCRLERLQAHAITLIIPPETLLRSHVGWRLIHARAKELDKKLLIICPNRQVRSVARAAGFKVAESKSLKTDQQVLGIEYIYIKPNEELTNVRERLEQAKAHAITLIIPPETLLHSHVGWRLIYARMRELDKELLIICPNRQVRSVARAAGFKVAEPDLNEEAEARKIREAEDEARKIREAEDEARKIREAEDEARKIREKIMRQKSGLIEINVKKNKELKIFYCYARTDQNLRDQLESHLSNLKRLYGFKTWFDRQINPGELWEEAIEKNLDSADIIFLLISSDFMASDYCYNKEMLHALKRHANNEAKVIPILLRPVHWKSAPFSTLQMLPTNARPATSWQSLDSAFYDIAIGVEQAIEELLLTHKTKEQWLEEGNTFYNLNHYEEALQAYQRAINLDPSFTSAYINAGLALENLNRYEETLQAYRQAIKFDPAFASAYIAMGNTLYALKRYEEGDKFYKLAEEIGNLVDTDK